MIAKPKLQQARLALAVTSALALGGLSSQATAAVYGGASLILDELEIFVTSADFATPVPAGSFDFFATNLASLNGVTANGVAVCNGQQSPGNFHTCNPGGTPRLDADQAFVTDSGVAEPAPNTFTLAGPGVGSYSRADSIVPTAALPSFIDDGSLTPTTTRNVAEAELLSRGASQNAVASSEISSSTGFTFTFDVASDGTTLSLSFEATPDVWVNIANDAGDGATASAEVEVAVSLTRSDQTGGGSVEWTPRGNDTADCNVFGLAGVVCTAADDYSLDAQRAVSAIPSSARYTPGTGNFSLFVTNLPVGAWTLDLAESKDVNLINGVPAPGVLPLFGTGFLLMAAGLKRRRNKG
jgi:hypothetical protein